MNIFLQIFLLLNVFLIGVLTAIAVRHAMAHFRPVKPEPKPVALHPAQVVQLPVQLKEDLIKEAAEKFHNVLDHSSYEFQHSLRATATQLNTQLENLGAEIVSNEMNRYRLSLDELREQAKKAFTTAESEVTAHQAELEGMLDKRRKALEASMGEEIMAEKAKLVAQIDTRLADAVASFLIETLGHNVDLGAQTAYLTGVLEEHKAEFKREVMGDETPAAK